MLSKKEGEKMAKIKSAQQKRDDIKNEELRQKHGKLAEEIDKLIRFLFEKYCSSFRKMNALEVINKTAEQNGLKLSRIAKRKYEACLYWCCENWDIIKQSLISNIFIYKEEKYGKNKRNILDLTDQVHSSVPQEYCNQADLYEEQQNKIIFSDDDLRNDDEIQLTERSDLFELPNLDLDFY